MLLAIHKRRPFERPDWLARLDGLPSLSAVSSPARRGLPSNGHVVATASASVVGAAGRTSTLAGEGLVVAAEAPEPAPNGAAEVADAYRRWGTALLGHVTSPLRFILHDAKRGSLLAASSSLAGWPMAYVASGESTLVGSSVLGLVRCPEAAGALDERYLTHLVTGLVAMPDGATAIRGVRRLLPGELLVADAGGMRVELVAPLVPRATEGTPEELHEAFLQALSAATTRAAVRSPVVSLSGGLDSAALGVAALARGRVDALSFVYPPPGGEAEDSRIAAMERAWPALRVTRVPAPAAPDLSVATGPLRDDPLVTPLALLPARVELLRRARDAGFRTVIEGEGGDELFAMLPTPLDALREGHLVRAASAIARSTDRRALLKYAVGLPFLPSPLQRTWLARHTPDDALLPAFATWGAGQLTEVRRATDEYRATLVHRPFARRVAEWLSSPSFVGAMASRQHLAAGFGLSYAWPLLDREVLELVLGLHEANALGGGGAERPFLRAALAGRVPEEVRSAPKDIHFYETFIPRVLASPRARAAVRDERVRRRLAHLVRFDRVEGMLDRLSAGGELAPQALWQLECLVAFAEWYGRASAEHGVE